MQHNRPAAIGASSDGDGGDHEQPIDQEWQPIEEREDEHALDIADLGTTQLVAPEVEATLHAWREHWALEHEREADRLDQEAHTLQDRLEADLAALRGAHERYLARLRWALVRADDAALQALEADVTARRERVAADNAAIDACRASARQHRKAARDLRAATFREQQGST